MGELRPLAGPIVIVDYDPEWPLRFRREEEKIRAALGDAAMQIEHAGSTSVPGLAAKPIIDIVLVVADSADEDVYVPALEAAGYVLRIREPDWFEHQTRHHRQVVGGSRKSIGGADESRTGSANSWSRRPALRYLC